MIKQIVAAMVLASATAIEISTELDAQIAGKQGNLYDLDPSSYTSLEDAIMTLGSCFTISICV